jgi:hypothetical protein
VAVKSDGRKDAMHNFTSNPIDILLYKRERRRQEQAARVVPYISFLLTHLALVLFLLALFFVDRLLIDPSARNIIIKGSLVGCAILALATEWGYAILCSRRWKRDILTLEHVQMQHFQIEESERRKELEVAFVQEQQKRRSLLFDLHFRQRRPRVEALPAAKTIQLIPPVPQHSPPGKQ